MSCVDDSGYLKGFFCPRCLFAALLLFAATLSRADELSSQSPPTLPYISYTNCRIATVPWSIHVVQLERRNPLYEIDSFHAGGKAIGMETLSDQLERLRAVQRTPTAGINGDFYQRDKAFAGAPRGLQIIKGELISAPCGGATFWIDAVGQFHTTNVASLFRITWPNGLTSAFGLNGDRNTDGLELYTPAIGSSSFSAGIMTETNIVAQLCNLHSSSRNLQSCATFDFLRRASLIGEWIEGKLNVGQPAREKFRS